MSARLVPAGLLLGLGLLAAPSGTAADARDAPPDAVYAKLTEQSVEVMRSSLKGEVRPRSAARARTAAVMLAAFAQQNLGGADAKQRATLRDAALEVAELIGKKDYAAALKRIDALPALKADATAKTAPVALEEKVDFKDLMTQFRATKSYGLGIEDRLDAAGRSPDEALPAKDLAGELLLDAYRTAVVGELMHGQKPPKGDVKEWQRLNDQMKKQALELAAAAQAKDGKAGYKAVNALNRTCDKCHQVFRKE